MAALLEARGAQVLELRDLRLEDLEPVLSDETIAWRTLLSWDFTPSAELVRRFVKIRALSGHALMVDGHIAGYSYFVSEDRKALLGDLYVMKPFAISRYEDLLLEASLNAIFKMPAIERVEAQLMMLRSPYDRPLPYAPPTQVEARNFMLAEISETGSLPRSNSAGSFTFENWSDRRQDEAAHLISRAYLGHIDSQINDQYRSFAGARRFLVNIVQYPGCGSFFEPGSVCAFDRKGRMVGLSLASLVADDTGHITQICVDPAHRRTGLGYELLRQSLVSLQGQGCTKTSLTVTASNCEAIALYHRLGFRALRRFGAFVWERA